MPEASPQPKRPRRFWRRLFRWIFLLGFLSVLALSGGLWWGYVERVSLANRAWHRSARIKPSWRDWT
ncbi:hypothetical protein [Verrucomicrobium spinosum]|uniref:hypothetical protein n=1 Tax=Verrucomicrobium spinosum TaxID=2736 RepID=UPI000A59426C|nr:hypothetical protein [Verrucomicrobium spinosum]